MVNQGILDLFMGFMDGLIYFSIAHCLFHALCGCYKEIYRVLKPGQCFMAFEWCITDYFDPKNQEHHKIKAEIEIGDGLPDIRYTRQCLEALKQAGFEARLYIPF
ncbi:hypothetical protein Pint_21054 [Pistacia integerrima]|uniref:Uncharacterized protein n=1 Tax=Pistacia integerrima TaxID=434235 RepID=A0ACC0X8I8_9ROSI|nr:hypothetical protein Pint_21054 [Pistacia integerrima]